MFFLAVYFDSGNHVVSFRRFYMNNTVQILTQAHQIIDNAGRPSQELAYIRNIFISPENMEAFGDDDLYLSLIKTLAGESANVAWPENLAAYNLFFNDCVKLRKLLKDSPSMNNKFNKEEYLSLATRLLESLKTPYYDVYSNCIFSLLPCFKEKNLFNRLLQDFYGLIIKTGGLRYSYIKAIVSHAASYLPVFSKNESLLADNLRHQLELFTDDKPLLFGQLSYFLYGIERSDVYVPAVMDDYYRAEQAYISTLVEKDPSRTFLASDLTKAVYQAGFTSYLYQMSSDIERRRSTYEKGVHIKLLDSEFLNKFAYNMTAREYVTDPAIAREEEIRDLELILISPKKSPILLGEAGVGKTSIVEGLCYRLQRGDVPELLKDKKIFKLTTTSLLSGTKYVGEMEDRIKQMTDELRKHPEVILFIDEIHTIVGAGSTESSNNDISNMLKPFIDRGDIKIIGATTTKEYQYYMTPDRALIRRFYPISIEEPTKEMTFRILKGSIPSITHETKVSCLLPEETLEKVLCRLIDLSAVRNQPLQRRTYLPELPLTILEMAFSFAALDSRDQLEISDIDRAVRHSNLLAKEVRAAGFSCD